MGAEPKPVRIERRDNIPLDKVEHTPEGFLIDTPIVTSIGIFDYTKPDGSTCRGLRSPEHVFSEISLATYEGKPVVITHDAAPVDKDNVAEEIVGTILSKGFPDGDDVRAKIIIHDIDAVKQSGIPFKVSPAEYEVISEKAAALGLSRAELIVRAVTAYEV